MKWLTNVLEHQLGSRPRGWSFLSPITGEKMPPFSLSFEFKYREVLSVLFHVPLVRMSEFPTEMYTDVSTDAHKTRKQ